MTLATEASDMLPSLVKLRRKLHQVPELGLNLPDTQKIVIDELAGLGLDIRTGTNLSSVTAVLHGKPTGHTVLLRGDMDALPIPEQTGLPWASTNGRMHACGHDLHISGLIGAARLLSAHKDELDGDVIFMFQPGEEGASGAKVMIDEGLLDIPGNKPEFAYGIHVWSSIPKGLFVTRPGAQMASSNDLRIVVHGSGGHGSQPSTTLDPVPVAAEIVLGIQAYVARHIDIFDPVVVSVTRLSAGVPINAIPDSAALEATVRILSKANWEKLSTDIPNMANHIAAANGCTAETTLKKLYPVTMNDPQDTAFAIDTLRDGFGETRVVQAAHPVMGAEDFSFVLEKVPGVFILLGAQEDIPSNTRPATNHSPKARFDDAVLGDEALALALIATRKLTQLAS